MHISWREEWVFTISGTKFTMRSWAHCLNRMLNFYISIWSSLNVLNISMISFLFKVSIRALTNIVFTIWCTLKPHITDIRIYNKRSRKWVIERYRRSMWISWILLKEIVGCMVHTIQPTYFFLHAPLH